MENQTLGTLSKNQVSIKLSDGNYQTVIDGKIYIDEKGIRIEKKTK